jgi:hypothetical protein
MRFVPGSKTIIKQIKIECMKEIILQLCIKLLHYEDYRLTNDNLYLGIFCRTIPLILIRQLFIRQILSINLRDYPIF